MVVSSWEQHHVMTELAGCNYPSDREVSPGRLLFVHDVPTLQAFYVDVERLR